MNPRFIITGTDTGIGKTVFSAMLMQGIGAYYWKPIQSGVEDRIDTRTVQNLTGLTDDRFMPEAYIFSEPLSPHRAAEIDGQQVDINRLRIPETPGPLLIEGAGGLMVPLTRKNLQINQFNRWNLPVILCARTALGTINHTLLSLEALWARQIPVHGIAFIGEDNPDTIRTITEFSNVKILGRLPFLTHLNSETLRTVFERNFKQSDFISPQAKQAA
jgi:dethiobiotin synthetase